MNIAIDPTLHDITLQTLAHDLGLPCTLAADYVLTRIAGKLALTMPAATISPLCVDFLTLQHSQRIKRANPGNELLLKALRTKKNPPPHILDLTAGFGDDGFLLAAKGFPLTWVERNPIMHALLHDGWQRLIRQPMYQHLSLNLVHANALNYLASIDGVDVIYLDPMYPENPKSALNQIRMRILRDLVGEDADADQVLRLALTKAQLRVVVKRPLKAPVLGGLIPHHHYAGKTVRYDIYSVNNCSA